MAFVDYELNDRIVVIRMNRPERLNALGPELGGELRAALKRFKEDDNAWVAILTGTGRGFCAGRDFEGTGCGRASAAAGLHRGLEHLRAAGYG